MKAELASVQSSCRERRPSSVVEQIRVHCQLSGAGTASGGRPCYLSVACSMRGSSEDLCFGPEIMNSEMVVDQSIEASRGEEVFAICAAVISGLVVG